MPETKNTPPETKNTLEVITAIICKECGHETSGPNAKSVKETAKRHEKNAHGW